MNLSDFSSLLKKFPALAKFGEQFRSLQLRDKLGFDNKQMLLVVPLCLAIVIYADIISVTRLQLGVLKKITPKIIKLKKDLGSLDKGLLIMQDLKDKQKETLAKSKKIIPEDQIDYILQDLSIIAKNDSVKIIQMKPYREPKGKPEKGAAVPKFTPLSINVDLICDYHHLGKFINDLEMAEILFAVEAAKIMRQQDNYFQQKVNLILKTYVKK